MEPNSDGSLTYSRYLRLDELLSIQHLLTPRDGTSRGKAAEHYFIVAHQASELWLRQALLDLEAAVQALGPPTFDLELVLEHLDRVSHVARMLVAHADALVKVPVGCFHELRQYFGSASGAQSAQFHALEGMLGLRGEPGHLYAAFLAAVEAHGTNVERLYRDELGAGPLYRIAEMLIDLAHRFWHWRIVHLDLVARMLGERPGTGGSSGVRYLVSRMRTAFPGLWEARGAAEEARLALGST
jgi:tryptophan 2,3-dioxygenase